MSEDALARRLGTEEEEFALQNKLYDDIASGRLTSCGAIAVDRGWETRLTIYRVRKLVDTGRIWMRAIEGAGDVLTAKKDSEVELPALKETLQGKTITNVTCRTLENGDQYHRIYLGNEYYEWLAHFTANDHQVAIAKEGLGRIELRTSLTDPKGCELARETLAKMKEATTWAPKSH